MAENKKSPQQESESAVHTVMKPVHIKMTGHGNYKFPQTAETAHKSQ